uniref:Pentacotripeptide-repeat region of PRORP domain-containing protein n=1 Tax=Alexandrium catenella TaxID=2925 RepID=A0A7S1L8U2_ALECA
MLSEMRREGVEPDGLSYCLVMNACFRDSEADMALEVFESILHAGIEPHRYAFESAIYACDVGRHWAKALRLLREARQGRLHPGVRAHSATMSACLKSQRWQEAQLLLAGARLRGTPLILGAAMSSMVLAYKRAEHWDLALDLLAELQDSGSPGAGVVRRAPWMLF